MLPKMLVGEIEGGIVRAAPSAVLGPLTTSFVRRRS
jgi:hypothetical protein